MSDTEITDNLTIKYMRKLHRWRMAFFGVIILLAGIVIGGASMMILMPRVMKPPRGPEFMVLRILPILERELGLTDEQSEEIRPILTEHIEKLHDIRTKARSEVGMILEQMNKKISAVLTDRQRQIWQSRLSRLQRELSPGGRRGNGRGGPHGGGMGEGPRHGRGLKGRFRQGPGMLEPEPFGPPPPPNEPNLSRNDVDRNSTSTNEKSKDGG